VNNDINAPCKRHGHRAVVHSHNMFLFGGITDHDVLCPNDLFCFNFRKLSYSPLQPLCFYSCLVNRHPNHNSPQLVTLAFLTHNPLLYSEKQEWSEVKAKKGDSPSPRHSHSAVVWKNSLFTFGGSSEKGESLDNTLHSFNFGSIFFSPPPQKRTISFLTKHGS